MKMKGFTSTKAPSGPVFSKEDTKSTKRRGGFQTRPYLTPFVTFVTFVVKTLSHLVAALLR